MPGRLAFVCAMPMELTPLKRKLALEKASMAGLDVYNGTLESTPVMAIVTGMGTGLARRKLENLMERMDISRVVVVGITGAVDNETAIGTLILPETVVDGATGTEYQPEPIADAKPSGKMWTTDFLITDLDVVAGLRQKGVVSLDMETAAIAEVCERRNIPWSVFRVVSDRASDGSIDEEVFHMSNQDGTPNPKAVFRYFLKHPGRIPKMARMAKGARLATTRAATAATEAAARLVRSNS